MGEFARDLSLIRERARQHMEQGAVTPGYKANREEVVKLLNEALATELVCVMRYKNHADTAVGIHSQAVAAEFSEHAREEQEHADMLAKRIVQLNGKPDYNPQTLTQRSHTSYVECENIIDMIRENLIAERIAIDTYAEMIRHIGDTDPTSRRVLEHILAQEEEHAEDMATLLANLDDTKR